jgi:Xaa-Pro aminopeptidase
MQGTKISPLIYADSESNADQLYFSKVFVPDPFLSFGIGKKKYAIINALEYTRVKKESVFDEVLSFEDYKERAEKRFRKKKAGLSDIIRLLADEYKIRSFLIASNFPVGLALELIKKKIKIKIAEGSLFPNRAIKNDEEAKAIREGNAASAAGIRAAESILQGSLIRNGKILYRKRYLTSELLREEIEIACLKKGGVASHTIAAGGNQACDPHCLGYGILRANDLIIVDVFPRIKRTGYYGDMTRTFVKGRANENQRKLIATVKKAHGSVLDKLKGGISASKIHNEVQVYFEKNGYFTRKKGDVIEGYFHGTGHGVGLEIHEEPRLSSNGSNLKSGMVVTVEPGLYYPGLGGCRIEDMVRLKRDGVEMLSKCHYRWEIS